MNRVFKTLTLSLVVLLSACQSAPPVPQDKYYRLTVTPGPTWTQPLLRDAVFVAPLRAEGLYAERAMLYASVQRPRELLQYHYQFWSEPPALLLQEHLRASLGASHLAAQVTEVASASRVGYWLNGKILRLEKLTHEHQSKAIVELRFVLQKTKPFETLWERNYVAEELLLDGSQNAYVIATELALQRIYGQLGQDVKALH